MKSNIVPLGRFRGRRQFFWHLEGKPNIVTGEEISIGVGDQRDLVAAMNAFADKEGMELDY